MLAVALPFHSGDCHLAEQLLRWIGKMSDVSEFDCVLVADCSVPLDKAIEVKSLAEKVFKSAPLVTNSASVSGWIAGANSLWYRALDWAAENGRSILFLEPDAIPLRPGWLQELAAAYSACGKAHMGHIAETNNAMLPPKCMSGVAIYGPEAASFPRPPQKQPFNVFYADLLLQNAAHTPLIRDFFGTKELPPVFVAHEQPDEPAHHFSLDWLPAGAVLYHRDKKHSLPPLLARRLNIAWEPPRKRCEKIAVVFPVHNGDIGLALLHALWLRKMNVRWPHRAVIAFDPTVNDGAVNQFRGHLEHCFESVEWCRYPTPPIPAYPASANWMFQNVAHHMAGQHSPWLLMEADAVVLKANWLDQLQAEYERAGKSWMGPLVHQLGHIQGTAVYPSDAAHRMPRTMACGNGEAFDMVAKLDMGDDRHDCGHLFFHTWSILNGQFCPVGGGEVPVNISLALAQTIPKSAVAIHRVKGRSLIDLLLTGQYVGTHPDE